jgi:phosphate-selective porin OprO and OprP
VPSRASISSSAIFIALIAITSAARAHADNGYPPDDEIQEALEARSDDPSRVTFEASPGNGATMRAGDKFSLNIRARIQLRYQLNIPEAEENEERDLRQLVNIGTARLWFSGHVLVPELTYMIQLAVAARDFRDGAVSPIFDAFLDWKAHRDFNLRAGQFFVPFDRLRTVREWALQMPDRPVPVWELTLDRDVGVMVYSETFLGKRSPIAYRAGAFGGGGTNLSRGRTPGGLLVGRLELRPLGPIDDDVESDLERRRKPAMALGGGVAKNFNTNRLRSTTGPTFTGGTTDYTHLAADFVFKWRGAMLQAEYLVRRSSKAIIESTDAEGAPVLELPQSGRGYVLQASYVFDTPFELVGRLSRLWSIGRIDQTFYEQAQRRGQELGFGANYYVNGHKMKLQADWIARMPHGFDFERADHLVHVQIDATF